MTKRGGRESGDVEYRSSPAGNTSLSRAQGTNGSHSASAVDIAAADPAALEEFVHNHDSTCDGCKAFHVQAYLLAHDFRALEAELAAHEEWCEFRKRLELSFALGELSGAVKKA